MSKSQPLKRAPREATVEDLLVFTHIPKCGGTTFLNIMRQVYGEDRVLWDGDPVWQDFQNQKIEPKALWRYRAVSGHFCYGLHLMFKARPVYVSLVRDPIERCASAIRFIQSNRDHYLHPLFIDKSLDDSLDMLIELGELRLIGRQCEFIGNYDNFEMAKQKIDNDYFVVSLVDRFDDFITLLRCLVFKQDLTYNIANETVKDPGVVFSNKSVKKIRTIASNDFKLCDYVAEKFERDWGYLISQCKRSS